MSVIDDNALILHYYGDDDSPQQRDLVAQALRASPELRARYAQLRSILDAARHDLPAAPDTGFEHRIWQDFTTRLADDAAHTSVAHTSHHAPPQLRVVPQAPAPEAPLPPGEGLGRGSGEARATQHTSHLTRGSLQKTIHHTQRPRNRRRLTAIAASTLLILATGFLAGRLTSPDTAAPPQIATTTPPNTAPHDVDPQLATRILDAYVAAHLRDTEGVLLTAMNSDNPDLTAGNADLAAALIDSNRLYTQAATRAGNTRLADFLRQMEPVLIELANPPRGDGIEVRDGLREYVRESDLLFQVRATEGALATRNLRT